MQRKIIGSLMALILILGIGPAYGQVVINEVSYDDSGTDDREFVELYNAGNTAVDISNWLLRASDTIAPPDDNNADYDIASNGAVLAPGDYWLMGSDLIDNADQEIGSTNLWENSNEVIELIDANGTVVDTYAYERNKGPVAISTPEGGFYGNFTSLNSTLQSQARWRDGRDTDNNGYDFGLRPATPGADNLTGVSIISSYTSPDVDGLAPGTETPGMTASFTNARVIDPTDPSLLLGSNDLNPNAIPPSPQGGNANVCWDPSGGGNMCASDDVIGSTGGAYLIWAYLDANPIGGFGAEITTYGLMGTTGTFHNLPDVSGTFFGDIRTANGNTGIGWVFEKEDSASIIDLHLVDFGAGGDSSDGPDTPREWIIIATMDLTGTSSCWHKLGINYDGSTGNVIARFGGQVFAFNTTASLMGGFYVGYRESVPGGTPLTLRPPTYDNCAPGLDVKPGSCPNPINLGSRGVVPVALLGSEIFDVADVDISTVTLARADGLGGTVAPHEGPPGPHSVHADAATPFNGGCDDEACCHDAGGDGITDLLMHFKTEEIDDAFGGNFDAVVLSGLLLDGTPFTSSSDCIKQVPRPHDAPRTLTVNAPTARDVWIDMTPGDLNVDNGGFAPFLRGFLSTTTVQLVAPNRYNGRKFSSWLVDGVVATTSRTLTVQVGAETTAEPIYLRTKRMRFDAVIGF